jgi:hypothetical protein
MIVIFTVPSEEMMIVEDLERPLVNVYKWMNEHNLTAMDVYSFEPFSNELVLTEVNRINPSQFDAGINRRYWA